MSTSKERPEQPLTPDKPFWYDHMITRGFIERDESYFSVFLNGNPSDVFRNQLISVGGSNTRLLDIGCGPGKYTAMLAPAYHDIVGLDLSTQSLAYARTHRNLPNLEFVLGDAHNLPFDNETFDVVSSRLSPHSLSEIMRVLKPGGKAFVMKVGEADALELRRLFGQDELVARMDALIVRGEPQSLHIEEQWREAGFEDVETTEHEYDMHFENQTELAKYLSRIPIIPEFDLENSDHIEMLSRYAEKATDAERKTLVLRRHRYIVKGVKPN